MSNGSATAWTSLRAITARQYANALRPTHVRTCVRLMIVCVLLPRFELTVAASDRQELLKRPAALAPEPGGVQRVGDVEIHAVPAMHSVSPGHAIGYVLRFADSRTLYHTGDTWVFGDMALVERFFHPAILLAFPGWVLLVSIVLLVRRPTGEAS